MKIYVCVKQVPDTSGVVAVNPDGTMNRAKMPTIINPDDLNAMEAALQLKESEGASVVAVSMGPPQAMEMMRELLAMGADEAVLVSGREFGGSDTFATSQIIAGAIHHMGIGEGDLILCGRQAIDGDTAQVGPQIAEKLEIPQVTYLEEVVDVKDGAAKTARIRRNIGNGFEIVEVQLPALLTVIETANAPRPFAAKKVMRNKHAAVPAEVTPEKAEELKAKGLLLEQWTLDDINADLNRCGLAGSPTKVFRVESIVLTKEGFTAVEPTEEGITGLIQELISERTL